MTKHTLLDCWNSIENDNMRGNKESTLRSYRDRLEYAIIPSFQKLLAQGNSHFEFIEDFDFSDYKIWFKYMKQKQRILKSEKKYNVSTLRGFYSILSRLFSEAVINGWIERNIVKLSPNFPFDKENYDLKKIKFQTLEQFNLFMSVVDDDFWYHFFSFLFWHGPRIGEMLALQIKDYSSEMKKISIYKTTTYFSLTNNKRRISSTKNYRHREIILNTMCEELFLERYNEVCKNTHNDPNAFIFSYLNHVVLYHSTVRQALNHYYNVLEKKLRRPVNRITTQQFGRHSIATLMRENGATAEQVAYYLGDSEDTIKKVYFHNNENKLDEDINILFTNIKNQI